MTRQTPAELRRGGRLILLLAGLASAICVTATAQAKPIQEVFKEDHATSGVVRWIVPGGVSRLNVELFGSGPFYQGVLAPDAVKGTVSVTTGEELHLNIGGLHTRGIDELSGACAGVTNPATELLRAPFGRANRLAVAAGSQKCGGPSVAPPGGTIVSLPGAGSANGGVGLEYTPALNPGRRISVTLAGGTVSFRRGKTGEFQQLTGALVASGVTIDARKGSVRVMTAFSKGRYQVLDIRDGLFRLLQTRDRQPVTQVRLAGRLSCPDGRGIRVVGVSREFPWSPGPSSPIAYGEWRIRGRQAETSARGGLVWEVHDRCDGTTLVRGARTGGRITVRDFKKKKTVLLRRGSYVAG